MIQDPKNDSLGVALDPAGKRLGRAEFQGLGEMPPELEWSPTPAPGALTASTCGTSPRPLVGRLRHRRAAARQKFRFERERGGPD